MQQAVETMRARRTLGGKAGGGSTGNNNSCSLDRLGPVAGSVKLAGQTVAVSRERRVLCKEAVAIWLISSKLRGPWLLPQEIAGEDLPHLTTQPAAAPSSRAGRSAGCMLRSRCSPQHSLLMPACCCLAFVCQLPDDSRRVMKPASTAHSRTVAEELVATSSHLVPLACGCSVMCGLSSFKGTVYLSCRYHTFSSSADCHLIPSSSTLYRDRSS